MKNFIAGLVAFSVITVGGIIYVIGGTTHVTVGSVAFVKHMDGQVTEIGQGWHWTGWGVGVQEYPTFMQSLVLSDNVKEGSKTNDQWKVGTADQQELPVNTSLTWSVDKTKSTALYQAVGGQNIDYIRDSIVSPTMKAVVNRITHDYGWNDVKGTKQGEVQDRINTALAAELAKSGIIVGKFGFTHVGAPAGMEEAQKSLAASELATKQAVQAQDKAKVENDTKIMQAQTNARANQIEADGLKAKAQSLSELLVQEEAIQKWDGKTPTTMSGNSVPFVNLTK